ncbi:MAG: hypothetical protein U1F20_11100 [Lysobacterales bacterium]
MNASTRNYTRVSALVFTAVALLQGWRAASGLALRIGDYSVPASFSWVACIAAAALAVWGWRAR